ncbi:MAG TPA: PAS domain-containing protein [Flavipsychrobacter sp.]|nr:PAS domain-containing protein [Flavipsychrobacter sp.]
MNKVLQEQINKYVKKTDKLPADVQALFQAISKSYDFYEADSQILKRTIEESSSEKEALNDKIKKEIEEENKIVFESLKESLAILKDSQEENNIRDLDFHKLSQIAKILKEETLKRKKAEKEKELHASHLESSQRIAHVGSWEFSLSDFNHLNNSMRYWSDETYRILGFEPGSITPSNDAFFTRVHPDDVPLLKEALRRSIEEGERYDLEHRIILQDGTEKIIHECADIIVDASNKKIKFIGTMRDITEKRKANLKLVKANNELRTLFENIREVFFTVDMEHNQVTQMSKSCEDIYGYTQDDFFQNSNLWIEVVLEEDKGAIWANDSKMREGKEIVNTYRIRNKNDEIKWLETKIVPTLDNNSKLLRIDGVTADITKRIEAEQALRDSEHRFRTFLENSSDAIVVVDENFDIVFASDSIQRVTGSRPEEVIGRSNAEFVYADDRIIVEKFLKDLLANPGEIKKAVYRLNKKDGGIIWTERVAINLINDPVIKGIVINFRNITEQKEYEDALKASNEELKKSNGELDRFVYSVSHDLRAPLSSMLGIIGLIEVETTDKNIAGDIQLIKKNINKLDGFISDILDYSRNARLETKEEEVKFANLLEYIKNNLKYMVSSAAKVNIRINIDECDTFYSDPGRMTIIFNNLISNAVRYSNPEAADPFVDIDVQSCNEKAVITIEDNGIGISKENHEKIFDMFYRISNKSIGSGLGLYIVKETVEKLHGTIQFESEPGKGTKFIVTIPNIRNTQNF